MDTSHPHTTDAKSCSPEDGAILIRANLHCVHVGRRTAVLHVNNWADGVKGIQYQVFLDFASTTQAPIASSEVEAVIARLFPEYST